MRCDIYVQQVEKGSHPWINRNKCVIMPELNSRPLHQGWLMRLIVVANFGALRIREGAGD